MFVLSEPMFTVALYCFNYGYFVPRTTTMMAMTTVRQPIRQGTATGWRIFGQWVMFNHARLGSVRFQMHWSEIPIAKQPAMHSYKCKLHAGCILSCESERSEEQDCFLRFALEALARVVRFGPCLPRAWFRCVWFFIEIFFTRDHSFRIALRSFVVAVIVGRKHLSICYRWAERVHFCWLESRKKCTAVDGDGYYLRSVWGKVRIQRKSADRFRWLYTCLIKYLTEKGINHFFMRQQVPTNCHQVLCCVWSEFQRDFCRTVTIESCSWPFAACMLKLVSF